MKKVLYLTNGMVPYRVRFFNALSTVCDLTVLYEEKELTDRNAAWIREEAVCHNAVFLSGPWRVSELLRWLNGGFDTVIIGCINSPIQALAMLHLRGNKQHYLLNLDGELFADKPEIKSLLKRFLLRSAPGYLAAGQQSARWVQKIAGNAPVTPYWFGSLWESEVLDNAAAVSSGPRNNTVLIPARYQWEKGCDVALNCARQDKKHRYLFVGMGRDTQRFLNDYGEIIPKNVEIIPFLNREELSKIYQSCAMMVLPSRQECWGLVIGEAASFGTPVISTWGSGAAVEFLGEKYPQYLAKPGDSRSLYQCICRLEADPELKEYVDYLKGKASQYTIERSVQAHLQALERGENYGTD